MTIKRRLFISNILMIVLPIILTIAMSITFILIFFNITNTQLDSLWQNRVTYVDEKEAGDLLQKYEDIQALGEIIVYKSDSQGYLVVFPDRLLDMVNQWRRKKTRLRH